MNNCLNAGKLKKWAILLQCNLEESTVSLKTKLFEKSILDIS